ncbi:hypothetical protein BJX61DRAFT_145755 [Aspergillus egyptiacus]|nr:hypothetical protein BJX61DRAFT_145755 [Aspergillus egyptiacus]
MAHRNRREMDVARSLVDMAQFPGQNTGGHHRVSQEELAERPPRQGRIKRERNPDPDNRFPAHAPCPRPRMPTHFQPDPAQHWTGGNAGTYDLQGHLIRQQLIAGIAPENIIRIDQRPQGNDHTRQTPNLLQITNDGVTVPYVPPATFRPPVAYMPMAFGGLEEVSGAVALTGLQRGGPDEIARFEPYAAAPRMNFTENDHDPYGADRYTLERAAANPLYPRGHEYDAAFPLDSYGAANDVELSTAGYLPGPDQVMIKPELAFNPLSIPYMKQEAILPKAEDISGIYDTEDLQIMHNAILQQNVTGLSEQDIKEETLDSTGQRVNVANTVVWSSQFNIIEALVNHPEIAIMFSGELHVRDLINLQTISRRFRAFLMKHLPKVIKLQIQGRLRIASHVFPWRCYKKLWCRAPMPSPGSALDTLMQPKESLVAFAPSFRWLQMIRHRDHTASCIINALTHAGYGFPRRFKPAILKLWFLMDIPDTHRRLWTVQNRNLWTDMDLFMAIFFIVRIDMFVKIKRGNHTGGQRRLIMAQRTLTFCHDVLTGQALRDDMELLGAFVRWRYNPPPDQSSTEIFGVPFSEVGSLQYEHYGRRAPRERKLRRPDELVLREAQRRQLNFQNMYRLIFIHAQRDQFTVCERRNVPWDKEVEIMLEGTETNPMSATQLDFD